MSLPRSYMVVGGAGFLGSHVVDRLLGQTSDSRVVVFDNFSSGRREHLGKWTETARLRVIQGDVNDLAVLRSAMAGCETVIHLASNPDIARAATEPAVDFHEGTYLTHNVLEAMRQTGTQWILYASGSGVYGDRGEVELHEDFGPLAPISTYGASKLAGEALISAYCHMFGINARVFRFGNLVGPRQTHGVGFDFLRQLLAAPDRLRILGDGSQSKSYLHVSDAVDAMLLAAKTAERFQVYNVATGDYVTVRAIAEMAIDCMGLDPERVRLEFTGGDRGWKGDVPVVRLDTSKIRALGWGNRLPSLAALRASMEAMLESMLAARAMA